MKGHTLVSDVWRKTMEEVDSGVLVGLVPLSEFPDRYPLSRRFGIKQVTKSDASTSFLAPVKQLHPNK